MSYLARLKQIEAGENFTHIPHDEPTKLTKGGFGGFVSKDMGPHEKSAGGSVSFVSTDTGPHEKVLSVHETEKVGAGETATAQKQPSYVADTAMAHDEPDDSETNNRDQFDYEVFDERAAICEFDGGLSRDEAEAVAWQEDDRRRCWHCLNLLPNGICKVASPGGLVSAAKNYRPVDIARRCEGYMPCPDDPDKRTGLQRWPGLTYPKGTK